MRRIGQLRDVADRYEGFIIDLWGVIHDGVTPFPGAVACLAALRAAGRRVVLLSNAPRRAAVAAAMLRQLGIADTLYDAIVTSGEATWRMLAERPDPWSAALGQRIYHLGPARDRSVFAGLDLIECATPGTASFVLNTGPDDEHGPADVAAFDPVLVRCRAASLPMLCANPDLVVVRGGETVHCAGALAQRYEAMGGAVRLIGKPDPAIYDGVIDTLGVPRDRIVAIGDSLRTDMAGAAHAGVDAIWILGGIHAHEDCAAAEAEAAAMDLAPPAAMHRLVW